MHLKYKALHKYSLFLFASVALLSGCSKDEYTDVNYGGSFLIDSLTVGFIRTENTIKEYPSFHGAGQSYVDGKQDLVIYSVPEKKVTKTIRFASGRDAYLQGEAMAVTYSKPWMMFENNYIGLFNINTGEKIRLADNQLYLGGLSPDGKYAFYNEGDIRDGDSIINGTTYVFSTVEKKIVLTVPLSTIFFVAENADFYLFKLLENPLYSYKVGWIVRSDFTSNSTENWDTLITLPESLWINNITDFNMAINLSGNKARYFDFDSLLNKKLHLVFSTDQHFFNSGTMIFDISFNTGVFTHTSGSNVYIGSIYQLYQDTTFLSSRTRE